MALVVLAPDLLDRHGQAFQFDHYPRTVAALAAFATAALIAVMAIVLPITAPIVRMFATMISPAERPPLVWALLATGYLVVWLGFTGAALAGDLGLHMVIAASEWLRTRNAFLFLSAVALVVAGLTQFLPLTRRCLTACRDPQAFLIQHYRRGRDGILALGARHALCCLGYCWPFLTVIFAFGINNLWCLVVLSAITVTERNARRGDRLVGPVGIALLAAGTWLGLSETLSPGFADINLPENAHHH